MNHEDQSTVIEKSPSVDEGYITEELRAEVVRMRMEDSGKAVLSKEEYRDLHDEPVTVAEAEAAAARIDSRES